MQFKYRAFDKRDNKMHEVFGLTALPSVCYEENSTLSPVYERVTDDIIIMRSTGLKDDNGLEVYEGDVLKGGRVVKIGLTEAFFGNGVSASDSDGYSEDYNIEYWICGVYFTDTNFSWDNAFPSHDSDFSNMIVVGNIYQNPELLNQT